MTKVKKNSRHLISFFINSSGYLVPHISDDNFKTSKTLYPYLLGKRNAHAFYNLEKSLHGIKASLEILKEIVSLNGKILFIVSSSALNKSFNDNSVIDCLLWRRGPSQRTKSVDLLIVENIRGENTVEIQKSGMLMIGVHNSTLTQISYPFNLNIEDSLLCYWFYNALVVACYQGSLLKEKEGEKAKVFSSLFGKKQKNKKTK